MLEKQIQKKILDYLNKLPKTYAFKKSASPYDKSGISDIICCSNGYFIAFEVKQPGVKPTALQESFLQTVRANGGVGAVVFSVEGVELILKMSGAIK